MIAYDSSSTFALKADPYVPVYEVTTVDDVIEEGSSTPSINKDANILTIEGATIDHNASITGQIGDDPSFTAQNPSVATVDADGNVTRVSNGTAKILVTSKDNNQILSVPVSRSVGATTSGFASWRAGSLAKYVTDRIAALTSGVTPSTTTRSLYSGSGYNTSLFCAAYGSSMSGIAYSVNGSSWMGFTAITNRHVVTVAHIGDYTGLQIKFGPPSAQVTRTLTARYVVPGTDVAVYLMDSAIPSTIRPLRLPPTDFVVYLPNPQFQVPYLFSDRNNLVNIGASSYLTSATVGIAAPVPGYSGFYNTPAEGTSGKPIMIPTGNASISFVLLGIFSYSTSGPALWAMNWPAIIPAVDAMVGISTGLQPGRVPLDYTQYP